MIERLATAALAAAPVVAAAATGGKVTPTIWHFLGYEFEAAGMMAALFACFMARFWIGAAQSTRAEHRWTLDIPVSGMALATAAGLFLSWRPEPFGALMLGAGTGVLGEGIFKLAEGYLAKILPGGDGEEKAS